jgi:uncharacterized glyoxalase superfamily protein PhnB
MGQPAHSPSKPRITRLALAMLKRQQLKRQQAAARADRRTMMVSKKKARNSPAGRARELATGIGLLTGPIATRDLDGTFERVRASGAEVVPEPMAQVYGVRDWAFPDPAGNLVRIQAALNRTAVCADPTFEGPVNVRRRDG